MALLGLYDRTNQALSKLCLRLFAKILPSKASLLRIKTRFSLWVKESALLSLYRRFLALLFSMRLKSFGTFLFSAGAGNCIIYLAFRFLLNHGQNNVSHLVFGAFMIIASLPFFSRRASLSSAVLQSKFAGRFFLSVARIREKNLSPEAPRSAEILAICGGALFTLLCVFFNPFHVVTVLICIVLTLLCFTQPEFGMALFFFSLSLLDLPKLTLLCGIVALCLLCKLLQGKRTLHFELVDLFVLFFALFCAGRIADSPVKEELAPLLLLLSVLCYFTLKNLSLREETIRTLCGMFCTGVTLHATSLLCLHFGARPLAGTAMLSLLENTASTLKAAMVVCALPFALFFCLRAKRMIGKLFAAFSLLILLGALYVFSSTGAFFAAAVCLLLLLLFTSGAFFFVLVALVIGGAIALPLIEGEQLLFLREALARRSPSLHLEGGLLSVSDYLFGVGTLFSNPIPKATHLSFYAQLLLGTGAFGLFLFALPLIATVQKTLFCYIHTAPKQSRLVLVLPLTSLCALLLMGLTQNLLFSPSLFVLFFLFSALCTASVDRMKQVGRMPVHL